MSQLSSSFFDEVDDFLFEAGRQGQFAEGSDYLVAMREIRSKRISFDQVFLDSVSIYLEREGTAFVAPALQSSGSPVSFESMEIELASTTMARKANRYYSPYVRQIEGLNTAMVSATGDYLLGGRSLVSSALFGFSEAQQLIKLSLELRVVFMKLFERHFLMRMEKLFLDSISILNNSSNREFVERLYSSSASIHAPVVSSCTAPELIGRNQAAECKPAKPDAKAVEESVNSALLELQASEDVPGFVSQMIEEQWRRVLLLIGLNEGVSSLEWQEAGHVLQLLLLVSSGRVEVDLFEESHLVEKLKQGLQLLKTPTFDQSQFMDELKVHLSEAFRIASASNGNSFKPEATVSPSGECILNEDDLSMISQLISGEPLSVDVSKSEEQAPLLACLSIVDRLNASNSAQLLMNKESQNCLISRKASADNIFDITNAGVEAGERQIRITRSRLGLALSLDRGEIQLTRIMSKSAVDNATVFEKQS